MKLKLLFFLLLFCIRLFSQHWIFPGSTWVYQHYDANGSFSGIEGIVVYVPGGTTILAGKTCTAVNGTFTGTNMAQSTSQIVIPNYRDFYCYEQNNVLFVYNGSSFDTVVNYSAAIGDKWLRPTPVNGFTCSTRRAMTVIDTGRVLINGFNLKKIVTTYTSSMIYGTNTVNIAHTNTVIERVACHFSGSMGNDLFPTYCEIQDAELEYPHMRFRCYSDNALGSYNVTQSDCYELVGLNTYSLPEVSLKFYPQPVENILFAELDSDKIIFELQIVNLIGELVSEYKLNPGKNLFDLSALPQGIFIVNDKISGRTITKLVKL